MVIPETLVIAAARCEGPMRAFTADCGSPLGQRLDRSEDYYGEHQREQLSRLTAAGQDSLVRPLQRLWLQSQIWHILCFAFWG